MPTVSVIIPAYNAAPFIGETLRSVFAQSFSDFEVIIINDGSPDTDVLEREIASYRARLNYLVQENRGAGAARNAGIEFAQGEYIAFLDADDIWLPDYLAEQIQFIRETSSDLVCADAAVFDESGIDSKTYMEALTNDCSDRGTVSFSGLIRGEQNLITSGVVAKREPVTKAGLFDESLRNAQDFDLWVRMTLLGLRLSFQRKPLLRYRNREGSLSGDSINRINREVRVYRKILAEYDLATEQRIQVQQAIQCCERERHLVVGKDHLNRGEFSQALASFRQAKAIRSNWKLTVSCLFLALAPKLLAKLNSFWIERRA
jgi:glycosyltransferase involved in cell wall biosynthesis